VLESNPGTAPGPTAGAVVLTKGLAHPEGPALLADGRVVFVETFLGRLSTWDERDGLVVYATTGGGPNACTVGTDGVYVAQNGGTAGEWRSQDPRTPAIERVTPDGRVQQVISSAGGEPLSAPNDLAFGPDGRLFFTDPGHFDPDNPTAGRVCAVDPDGTARILVETGPTYPNGIAVEADGSVIWSETYPRTVRRRRPDGSVELIATLPEGHLPDGLKIAADDSIYVASITSGGVDVLSPDGSEQSFVETGGEPLNLLFDGQAVVIADFGEIPQYEPGTTAAAPASGRLLRVEVGVAGKPLHRGSIAG
jgi:gluconolactonase